mmetsp:Transcript_10486/g.19303  ORF Transcript_10486/g.19303 Transcript_10486/m.19303 type:complete len:288 (-) Transcript_10486:722-1585(-)
MDPSKLDPASVELDMIKESLGVMVLIVPGDIGPPGDSGNIESFGRGQESNRFSGKSPLLSRCSSSKGTALSSFERRCCSSCHIVASISRSSAGTCTTSNFRAASAVEDSELFSPSDREALVDMSDSHICLAADASTGRSPVSKSCSRPSCSSSSRRSWLFKRAASVSERGVSLPCFLPCWSARHTSGSVFSSVSDSVRDGLRLLCMGALVTTASSAEGPSASAQEPVPDTCLEKEVSASELLLSWPLGCCTSPRGVGSALTSGSSPVASRTAAWPAEQKDIGGERSP